MRRDENRKGRERSKKIMHSLATRREPGKRSRGFAEFALERSPVLCGVQSYLLTSIALPSRGFAVTLSRLVILQLRWAGASELKMIEVCGGSYMNADASLAATDHVRNTPHQEDIMHW